MQVALKLAFLVSDNSNTTKIDTSITPLHVVAIIGGFIVIMLFVAAVMYIRKWCLTRTPDVRRHHDPEFMKVAEAMVIV